ncbi:MAG: sugar phosphate isomerase/epimerase [Rhodospirillaceae bacterium]|nr:sugar phosphate isomerase/epimerase [Rhodospirillaceae bacterium]MYH35903.1 sugar phosphate isomerase/epimerase [Rhodospirillaceae bacterium]MYK14010.1 sugar phosphate isomerase/epimerase [Rhodospirillaceae bacterium]
MLGAGTFCPHRRWPFAEMTRPLSLSYYTVPELSPLETVAVAAQAGCSHVGLRLLGGQPGGGEMPLLLDPALQADLLEAMADTGITALDANTARIVPETRVADYIPFLDAAARLGARHVMASVDDAERDRSIDNIAGLCELAAERGLTVDLEFVPWMALNDLAAAADMVRACNRDVLGIAVDTLHFHRSGSSVEALALLPRRWFRYAQLCDAPATGTPPSRDRLIHEATKERLLPGAGDIDLAGILRALPGNIPLALEIPQTALATRMDAAGRVSRAVAATRRLLDRV